MAVHTLDRIGGSRAGGPLGSIVRAVRGADLLLLADTALLTVIGFVLVYSASRPEAIAEGLSGRYFLEHQIVYAAIGVVVMVVFTVVDYRRVEEWGYWLYGVAIVGLAAVLSPVGKSTLGSQRWISLGPIQLQPSEFAVIGLIFAVACYVARREAQLVARDVLALLGIAALPMLLVVKQPDLGTGIVMGIVLALMLVISGLRLRYLAALVAAAVLVFVAAGVLHLLDSNELARLTCFLHQNSTAPKYAQCEYNLVEAKTAIGAGGWTGAGYLNGAVTNLGYVPIAYADFVFSALGEQFGFLGCAAVLALFALLLFRVVRAMQGARDVTGRLLCAGVLAFVGFSVFQNVGMNIGIMPITGIPLPFESYGGSALLAFYAAVGIVHNVELRRGTHR